MSKVKSIVRISGEVGGMTFYEQDGQGYVRNTSSLSKDRIQKDPAFRRTRENMAEFGGAALVAKSLRDGMAQYYAGVKDRRTFSRLVAIMRAVCGQGAGLRGRRNFSILPNGPMLQGFEFNRQSTLSAAISAPFTVSVNAARDTVIIDLPDFNSSNLINAPEGATHFRLVNAVSVLSDFQYNATLARFEATEQELNEINASAVSNEIPLGGMVGSAISLVANLTPPVPLTSAVAVIASLGIEFCQIVNGQYYLLARGNAMRIVEVF